VSPFKDSNEKWPDLLPLGIVGIHEAGSRWYWTGGQYRAVALLHLSWWDGMSSCKESNHPRISMSQIKSSIIVQTRSMGSCKDSQGLCASTWFSLHWFVFCYIVCVCAFVCVCACVFFLCVCVCWVFPISSIWHSYRHPINYPNYPRHSKTDCSRHL
jgi:hypothetical protein